MREPEPSVIMARNYRDGQGRARGPLSRPDEKADVQMTGGAVGTGQNWMCTGHDLNRQWHKGL